MACVRTCEDGVRGGPTARTGTLGCDVGQVRFAAPLNLVAVWRQGRMASIGELGQVPWAKCILRRASILGCAREGLRGSGRDCSTGFRQLGTGKRCKHLRPYAWPLYQTKTPLPTLPLLSARWLSTTSTTTCTPASARRLADRDMSAMSPPTSSCLGRVVTSTAFADHQCQTICLDASFQMPEAGLVSPAAVDRLVGRW